MAQGDFLRKNLEALKGQKLSPEEFTTLYLLMFLRIKHPNNWIQNKSRTLISGTPEIQPEKLLLDLIPQSFDLNIWENEKLKGITPLTLFSLFNLKGIPQSVHLTMVHWLKGLWKIEMFEHIPSPRELLRLQVKNSRCLTLITDPKEIDLLVLASRDPLSFALHDLMHAHQFFNQKVSQIGQLGFYQVVNEIYDRAELCELIKNNNNFKKEFEYVTSDMNAYVIHLFKCLKSSFLRSAEGSTVFNNLLDWWKMNEQEKISSYKLNTPHFDHRDEFILKTFFESSQEIFK